MLFKFFKLKIKTQKEPIGLKKYLKHTIITIGNCKLTITKMEGI